MLIVCASLGVPSPTASTSICWAPCSLSVHRLAFQCRRPPRAAAGHHAHCLCIAWRSIADGLHERLLDTMFIIGASLGGPSPTASTSIRWAPCSLSVQGLASIADGLREHLLGTMLIVCASVGGPSPKASTSVCWTPCSSFVHRLEVHRRRPPRASAGHHGRYLCIARWSIADASGSSSRTQRS